MRITLLLANCEPPLLKQSVQTVIDVLTELEVEIQRVDLHKLPYYSSEGSPVMDAIIKALDNSEAVIAISNVVMYGLHGAMQSFFDHCTLYPHVYFDKPLFAITYSNWLGEYEGAQQILRSWNTIGGVDAGCVCLNKVHDSSVALSRLEKEVENFYRIVRQGKANIGCSARAYYYKAMEGKEVMPHNNKTVSTTNNNINNKPVTINNQIKADKVVPVNTNEAIENSSSPYGNNDKQAPIPPTIIKATDNQSGVREFNTVANDKIYPPQVDDVNDIPIMTNPNRSYSAYKKNNQNFQNELFNKDKANDAIIGISLIISLLFSVGIFILIPTTVGGIFSKIIDNKLILNLIEGIIRISILFAYIVIISKNSDIKRVFQYHGAEHKSIHCYESGLELTVENAKKFTTLHPRCGTNFLFIVMFTSIILFSFFGWPNPLVRVVMRILFIPIVAGISYEIIKFLGKYNNILSKIVAYPGMMLQKITTKEPNDEQLEVAIKALKAVI